MLLCSWCILSENKDQHWCPPPVNSFDHLRQALTFVMPPKKTAGPRAALQPLDVNQETLHEARSQKRKATSPTPQEEELDQEIRDLEAIQQQVQKKREKMLCLADLQRKIDEAAEEMRHLTQDDQDQRPQYKELRQENSHNDDEWYGDFHHRNFAFDDTYPLAAELQATPWPPSYKPPQLPMYDGHLDPKQFLMSLEATISSYGGNTVVMAKSFVMAVKSVAQTWYSSLRLGTITSWKKLKDMLITSFQGFQMKSVIAQALFQCMQDHEEYLQAYVRRFLRLRAQAPTVPNEIVIEAMIKGLWPGPTAQYFARKPHKPWRSFFKRWMSISGPTMISAKEWKKHTCFLRWPGASEEEFTKGTSGRSIIPTQVMIEEVNLKGSNTAPSLQGHNKAPLGHQPQEAEVAEASEEDTEISPEDCFSCSAVKTKATPQEHAKSQFRSKKRLPKLKHGRISQSRSYILLHAILPMSQNT
jgi:hypothetical protein